MNFELGIFHIYFQNGSIYNMVQVYFFSLNIENMVFSIDTENDITLKHIFFLLNRYRKDTTNNI